MKNSNMQERIESLTHGLIFNGIKTHEPGLLEQIKHKDKKTTTQILLVLQEEKTYVYIEQRSLIS